MRLLNDPLLCFLGPSGMSVSYRCTVFVLHTTLVSNVIVCENGAPEIVEGTACAVTRGPAFEVSPTYCVVNSPGLLSVSGQGQVC